jgi:DNA-binding CsgD family transcriptional regulator
VPAIIPITNQSGDRRFLYVVPVTGHGRDVFLATAAVVVVVEPDRARLGPLPAFIRQALCLTKREAQIAALIAEGLGLPTIAERLRLGLGTLRNHVKSIFRKTGTRRQAELVALLCALRL